jgi:hypothetical protein
MPAPGKLQRAIACLPSDPSTTTSTLVSAAIRPIYQQLDATDISNRLEIKKAMDGDPGPSQESAGVDYADSGLLLSLEEFR